MYTFNLNQNQNAIRNKLAIKEEKKSFEFDRRTNSIQKRYSIEFYLGVGVY